MFKALLLICLKLQMGCRILSELKNPCNGTRQALHIFETVCKIENVTGEVNKWAGINKRSL